MSSAQSIDDREVKKFAELKNHWWNREGPLKTLHDINPLRLAYIEQFCPLNGLSVLDVGCGGGILSLALDAKGAIVTAIDADINAIDVLSAEAKRQQRIIQTEACSIEAFTAQGPFDVLCCMELLEHVEHYNIIIEHAARLLKPSGYLFLSTLNRTPRAYCSAIIAAEYVFSLLPRQTHQYDRFIRPSELAQVLRHFEFTIEGLTGMSYFPFSRTASFTPSVAVNYLMAARLNKQ